MARDSNAVWAEIDPSTLEAGVKQAYESYKAQYRAAKEARLAFETALAAKAELASGQRMIFGYNFGKLSVAIVADDRPQKKQATPKLSLAQWLAEQAA